MNDETLKDKINGIKNHTVRTILLRQWNLMMTLESSKEKFRKILLKSTFDAFKAFNMVS
jgi:hypothetical protein